MFNVKLKKLSKKKGTLESENSDIGASIYNLYMISKVLNVPINNFFEKE